MPDSGLLMHTVRGARECASRNVFDVFDGFIMYVASQLPDEALLFQK
jgi:hypothetical protein